MEVYLAFIRVFVIVLFADGLPPISTISLHHLIQPGHLRRDHFGVAAPGKYLALHPHIRTPAARAAPRPLPHALNRQAFHVGALVHSQVMGSDAGVRDVQQQSVTGFLEDAAKDGWLGCRENNNRPAPCGSTAGAGYCFVGFASRIF
jgi:hypothetical protein